MRCTVCVPAAGVPCISRTGAPQALTLDGFNATCTAAVSGATYTFTLKYPLEPAERVAAKTAEAKALIVAANFPDKMAAAAANQATDQERRRLNVLSVDANSVTAWFSLVPSECAPRARILGPQDTPGSSGRPATAMLQPVVPHASRLQC